MEKEGGLGLEGRNGGRQAQGFVGPPQTGRNGRGGCGKVECTKGSSSLALTGDSPLLFH